MCFKHTASSTLVAPPSSHALPNLPRDPKRYERALSEFPLKQSFPNYPVKPHRNWMRLYKGISLGDMANDGWSQDTNRHGEHAIRALTDSFYSPSNPAEPTTATVKAAAGRLKLLAGYETRAWTPDIIFKAFDDLDEAFFQGQLLGKCALSWHTEEEFRALSPLRLNASTEPCTVPVREASGATACKHAVKIRMNAQRIFLDDSYDRDEAHGVRSAELLSRWALMWSTLLHEMVHCYLHVATSMLYPDHMHHDANPAHGLYFQVLNDAVSRRMRPIFGFGLKEYNDACLLFTMPVTPELRRREWRYIREFREKKRVGIEKWVRSPEEWAMVFPAKAPNIRVWK